MTEDKETKAVLDRYRTAVYSKDVDAFTQENVTPNQAWNLVGTVNTDAKSFDLLQNQSQRRPYAATVRAEGEQLVERLIDSDKSSGVESARSRRV